MSSQIDELVRMRDVESLYEVMTEDEEWLTQFDAAEGLIRLGDRRAYDFVLTAMLSDDDEIHEVAQEIIDSPEWARMNEQVEAERKREHGERIVSARKRLQSGGKVFRYKTVYLPSGAIISDDSLGKGFNISALEEHGLEGWEVIHMLPSRSKSVLTSGLDAQFTGAYFLLKKEVLPGEIAELENE